MRRTLTHTHTQIHTVTHSQLLTLTYTREFTLTHNLTNSNSLVVSHTSHSFTLSLTHTYSQLLLLPHYQFHTYAHSHTYTLTQSTHKFTQSHPLTHARGSGTPGSVTSGTLSAAREGTSPSRFTLPSPDRIVRLYPSKPNSRFTSSRKAPHVTPTPRLLGPFFSGLLQS